MCVCVYMIIIKYTRNRKEEEKDLIFIESNDVPSSLLRYLMYAIVLKPHSSMQWALLFTSEKVKFREV